MWVLWGAGQGVHCPPPSLQDSEINFCQAQPKSPFELGCSWFYSQLLRPACRQAGWPFRGRMKLFLVAIAMLLWLVNGNSNKIVILNMGKMMARLSSRRIKKQNPTLIMIVGTAVQSSVMIMHWVDTCKRFIDSLIRI